MTGNANGNGPSSKTKAATRKARARVKPVETRRWWVVQTTATLESVATSNFVCYGRGGVPRYPADQRPATPPAESHDAQDPAVLCVELIARDPGGETRLALLDLTLKRQENTARQIVWSGYDAERHLQVVWVWDFYRILSHVALRIADPPPGTAPAEAWQGAVETARVMGPGMTIALSARSACGDIRQSHTLAGAAAVWEPK